jgi:response regulator NasT
METELIFVLQDKDAPLHDLLDSVLKKMPQAVVYWPIDQEMPAEVLGSAAMAIWDLSSQSQAQKLKTAALFKANDTGVFILSEKGEDLNPDTLSLSQALGLCLAPSGPAALEASLQVALANHRLLCNLLGELEKSNRYLEERRMIERAKWVIMREKMYGEDQAMTWLRNLSRNQNQKMVDIAKKILGKDQINLPEN